MTRFQNRIIIWSSLHKPVWISRLSHRSALESLVYWVHNGHIPESPFTVFGSHEWVWNVVPRNHTNELTQTYTRIHTHSTHINTHTYAYTPSIHDTYTYTYTRTRIQHTLMRTPNTCVHPASTTLVQTRTQSPMHWTIHTYDNKAHTHSH